MPSITQISKTPAEAKDEWRTPRWLFEWLDERFGFEIDLAASDEDMLCYSRFTKDDDALRSIWRANGKVGFVNPPYSDIDPWLVKAVEEARKGFTTVFLIPAPNGEDRYGDHVFGVATEVVWITGRIAFIDSTGRPVGGNTRGSCVVVYEAFNLGDTRYRHVRRDDIRRQFDPGFARRRNAADEPVEA